MANKDYTDFYTQYTPKSLRVDDETDTERDLSSYSKTPVKTEKEAPKKAAAPSAAKRTAPSSRNISSSSKPKNTSSKPRKASKPANLYLKTGEKYAKGVINKYGEICMVSLGTIIKIIAFIVAFATIIGSLILAIMLFASKSGLSALSLVAIIAGTVLAAIFFFPIYGIGHIICQNNEILRIFTDGHDE